MRNFIKMKLVKIHSFISKTQTISLFLSNYLEGGEGKEETKITIRLIKFHENYKMTNFTINENQ